MSNSSLHPFTITLFNITLFSTCPVTAAAAVFGETLATTERTHILLLVTGGGTTGADTGEGRVVAIQVRLP